MTSNDPTIPEAIEAPTRSRFQRQFVIGSLYLVSDIGITFFFGALTTILLNGGVDHQTVGLIALLGLLYFVRFACGPIIDHYGIARLGHYRGWIVLTQILLVAALALLAQIDPFSNMPALLVLMGTVLFVCSVHDTAINGLAVKILATQERGLANGIQIAAASVSIVLGSGGALLLYSYAGWAATVWLLAAIFVIPLVVMTFFQEEAGATGTRTVQWKALVSFFRLPGRAFFTVIVIPLLVLGLYLITAIQSALLLHVGWTLERIALVQNVYGPICGAAAALITGYCIGRFGRLPVVIGVSVLASISVLSLFPLASGGGWQAVDIGAILAIQIAYSAAGAWIFTIAMDLSRIEHAATDFSVQLSVVGILRILTTTIGLSLIPVLGYANLWLFSVVATVAGGILTIVWYSRREGPSS